MVGSVHVPAWQHSGNAEVFAMEVLLQRKHSMKWELNCLFGWYIDFKSHACYVTDPPPPIPPASVKVQSAICDVGLQICIHEYH